RFWDIAYPKEVKKWKTWGAVHVLALSRDDDRLLTSQSLLDKWQLHRFDVPTGRSAEFPETLRLFLGETITDMAAAKEAPGVALICLAGGRFHLVDEKAKSTSTIKHEGVQRVAVAADGKAAAAAGADGIRLWERSPGLAPGHHLKGHTAKKV